MALVRPLGSGRWHLGVVPLAGMLAMPACAPHDALAPSTELIQTFARAERRPAPESFALTEVTIDGTTRRAIAADPVTRVTWQMQLPDRAVLQTFIALKQEAWTQPGNGVLFRIGIADDRVYEELLNRLVDPFHDPGDRRWIPVTLDLRAYSGFKWSIFYRPRQKAWRVIFNTNAGPPGTADVTADLPVWGEPTIGHYTRTP